MRRQEITNSCVRGAVAKGPCRLSCPVPSRPVLSRPIPSCPVPSHPVLSCPVLSRPVLSCPVLSCPVLSCPVLSCPVLSCPVLSCPVFKVTSPPDSLSVHRFIMSATRTDCNDWFNQKLGGQLATFDDNTCQLLSYQQTSFNSACTLLEESAESLRTRSRQQRSVVVRARQFLADIFQGLGPEVFLLCTLAVPTTKLAEIASSILFPAIREWWDVQSRPLGLARTATALCTNYISTAILLIRSPHAPKPDGTPTQPHHGITQENKSMLRTLNSLRT
jgi:hypothetical protein